MDYIIRKTDTATNGQFTIKPYTTNGPADPTHLTPLSPHAVSAHTSLILLGKGMNDYGELVASNFVHLLENFAGPIEPVYPIQGQLWYNNNTKNLLLFDGDFAGQSLVINGKLTADLNVNNYKITNLSSPIGLSDAVTKGYADTHYMPTTGSMMGVGGDLTFNGGEVLGLPATPSIGTAATSKVYVDGLNTATRSWASAQFLPLLGGTITGNVDLTNNAHIYLPTPTGGFTLASDVVNKSYVDSALTSASNGSLPYVKLSGDTITGSLTIDGTALYTGAQTTILSSTSSTHAIVVATDVTSSFLTGSKFRLDIGAQPGYQIVNVGGAITPSSATGLLATTPATPGYATITISATPTVTPTTAVAIAPGTYDIDVTVSGILSVLSVVITGSETLTNLATILTGLMTGATAAAVANTIVVTNASTGPGATVVISTGTTGANPSLLTALDTGMVATHILSSAPGILAIPHVYSLSVTIDGTLHPVSIIGSNALTYATLLTEITTDLSGAGAATISGGNIVITSASSGVSSTVSITDVTLLASLLAFVSIQPATPGVAGVGDIYSVSGATYSSGTGNTTITVASPIPTATSGTITGLFGLLLSNGAPTSLHGNFSVAGSHVVDLGSNVVKNVGSPIVNGDAANKLYVDTVAAAAAAASPNTTLTSATFLDNTLSIHDSSSSVVSVGGIAAVVHEHKSTDVYHNALAGSHLNSILRGMFYNTSVRYPYVSVLDVVDAIDAQLYDLARPNDRIVTTISSSTITKVSLALSSDLSVTAVTTGAGGTITVAGGDFTTTFILGVALTLSGNTGVPTDTVLFVTSSVFNSGPSTTTITINGTVDPATTASGVIKQSYGAVGVTGALVVPLSLNTTVRIRGNTVAADADLTISDIWSNSGYTFVYATNATPLNPTTTASGNITTREIALPFQYQTNSNRLQVYGQGLKLYGSTRGHVSISAVLPIGNDIIGWYPTSLLAGSYSFDIAIDGGITNTISVPIIYTDDAVTGVDLIHNTITIGVTTPWYYSPGATIEIVNNIGIGSNKVFTVVSVVTTASSTTLTLAESLGLADVSGAVHLPINFYDLTVIIQNGLNSAYPVVSPTIVIVDGKWHIYSPTSGSGSSVVFTDITLLAELNATVFSSEVGATYGFSENGHPFNNSQSISLASWPTVGDVYEIINTR